MRKYSFVNDVYANPSVVAQPPLDSIDPIDPINRLWEEIRKLQRSAPAFVELSCKNCGAKIQQKYEDQIIKCPYCKTVYVIGYKQVNVT